MKAAVLHAFGSPLSVETVPDPELGTGEVVVDVVASRVLSYAGEVFSGERRYLLQLPCVPGTGAIGRVRAVGPDAARLKPGDWVYCDPTVRARDDAETPEIILQGLTAGGEGGLALQRWHRDGAWAERMRVPTENAVPIGEIRPEDAGAWCQLGTALVPYGGWLRTGLQAGETALVSGATGNFGSAAVALALAMGAGCVIAPGRNASVLAELERRHGERVRTVRLTGEEAPDTVAMKAAAPGGAVDCVLDILPPSAPASASRAALMTVRPYGRVALMGGVGMLGGAGLELPYPWIMRNCVAVFGQWMYPPHAVARLIGLVRAGLLKLDGQAITEFGLDQVNEAVAHAAARSGPFEATVIRP